jgi:hypothetical protein
MVKVLSHPMSRRCLDSGKSLTWLRWRVQPAYIGESVSSFVLSATGNSPDESAVQHLIQIINHLAELRLNCNLKVK